MPQRRLLYMHNVDISTKSANLVQVVSMCNAWSATGYRVLLTLRSSGMHHNQGKNYLQRNTGLSPEVQLHLMRSPLPGKISRHLSPMFVRRVMNRYKPHLCFVRDPVYFNLATKSGIPTVMELHNNRMHHGIGWLNQRFSNMVKRGSRRESALMLIAISHQLGQWWEDAGIPGNKLLVLHDGFNPDMFINPQEKLAARQRLGLPSDRNIVVYTGNLQQNRGIHYILKLALMNPDLLFVLAGGKHADMERVQQETGQQGIDNIRLLGHIPHPGIPDCLYAADVLLAMWSAEVPTIAYCSPLKVFEYMASGRPAVYPAYPTIREVVTDGLNGFLAPPDDPGGLHHALHRALGMSDDERALYEESSRSVAFDHYSWHRRVSAIQERLPENLRTL